MDDTELRNSLTALHSASFAWAMVYCRDRDLAEEVLQSVYVKVLDDHAPHKGRSQFRTWLFAVIRNAARDQRRKRWWSRVLRLDFESLGKVADSTHCDNLHFDDEDALSMVRAALGQLPERQRQVAHLVFYEDLTIADAAKVMRVTVGSARQHYARANESIKVLLNAPRSRPDEAVVR